MDGFFGGSDFWIFMILFLIHVFMVKTSLFLGFCNSDAGKTSMNQQENQRVTWGVETLRIV